MADLLKLVDQLIGSILQGNIYTDTDRFTSSILQRPDSADAHVPNTDPRLLNTGQGTTHPHADSNVIPPPPHSPPPQNREGMYKPGPPPADVSGQVDRMTANTLPEAPGGVYGPPREVVPQTQANTGAELTPKNIPVGHTPQSIADRNKIYESSNHRNRAGNPIDDLLSFHDSIEKSTDFAKARSFQNRQQFYSAERHDGGSEAQIKSNIGGGGEGPEGQLTSRPTLGDQSLPPPNLESQKQQRPFGVDHSIPPRSRTVPIEDRKNIYSNQIGSENKTSSPVHANIGHYEYAAGDGVVDSAPGVVPSSLVGKAPDLTHTGDDDIYEGFRPRTLQQPIPRNEIYLDKKAFGGPAGTPGGLPKSPPLSDDPVNYGEVANLGPSQIADLAKGKQFDSTRRADIYENYRGSGDLRKEEADKIPSSIHAGIGGGPEVGGAPNEEGVLINTVPTSNPTLGDKKSIINKPPTGDLLIKGPTDTSEKPRDFKQPEGLDRVSDEYRKEIYSDKDSLGIPQTPNGNPPAPQVDIGGPGLRPTSLPGKPPADPLSGDPLGQVQHLSPKEISDLQSSKQFDSERRADIYQNYQNPHAINRTHSSIHASIGTGESVGDGIPTSRLTLGDKESIKKQPPTGDLLIKGPTDTSEKPREFKQPEGLDRVSEEYRKEIYLDKDSNGNPLTPDGKPKSDPLSADPVNLPEVVYPLTTEPPFGDAPRSRIVPETPRADFYQNYRGSEDKNPSAVHANIGHFQYADGDGIPGKYLNADDIGQPKDFAPTQGKIRAKEKFAHRLGNIFHDNSTFGSFPGEAGSLRFFDIVAGVQWLDTVGQEVLLLSSKQNDPITGEGKVETTTETFAKSTTWLASQFLLTAMNPTDTAGYGELNAIWNPLSLPLSALPLLRSTPATNITAGAVLGGILGGPYSQNVLDADKLGQERLVQIREGEYKKSVDGTMLAQLRLPDKGFKGDLASAAPGGTPTIESNGLFGAILDLIGGITGQGPFSIPEQIEADPKAVGTVHTNLYTSDRKYDEQNAIFPLYEMENKILTDEIINVEGAQEIHLSNRFISKKFPGAEGSFFPGSRPGLSALTSYSIKDRSLATDGFGEGYQLPGADGRAAVVDVGFPEEEDGLLKKAIEEDQTYLPLMFQDLRDNPPKFLYFRAFLKPGMAETFTPDWQVSRYYGRVDQIPIYQGTVRSLNFSFDVVAWGPNDLSTMWKKLNKLQSMVYPTYTTNAFMKAGPIVRLRIGDLIAGKDKSGLPGYMTSMDWSYDDGIWNITSEEKVPRKISISIGFTVLHDGNPGIYTESPFEIDPNNVSADSTNDAKKVFGAATFKNNGNTTTVTVSPEEIRRIFNSKRMKVVPGKAQ